MDGDGQVKRKVRLEDPGRILRRGATVRPQFGPRMAGRRESLNHLLPSCPFQPRRIAPAVTAAGETLVQRGPIGA